MKKTVYEGMYEVIYFQNMQGRAYEFWSGAHRSFVIYGRRVTPCCCKLSYQEKGKLSLRLFGG